MEALAAGPQGGERPNDAAGEKRAERDARCQTNAAEQHDDHHPPEHPLNVLRYDGDILVRMACGGVRHTR